MKMATICSGALNTFIIFNQVCSEEVAKGAHTPAAQKLRN